MGPGDSGAAATTSHEAREYALQASRRAGRSLERSLEAVGRAANHSALLRELAAAIVAAAAAPGVADVLLERGLQADTLRSVRVEVDDVAGEIVIRAALGAPSDGVDQADQADLAEEPSAPASTAGRQLATLAGYAAARRSLLYQAERRDRQLLQAVVDELPIGVVVVEGPDGREVLANPEARRILGRSIGG
jgi:PAS domain-containing protein